MAAIKVFCTCYLSYAKWFALTKTSLKLTAAIIAPHIYYYFTCFCFSWNVPCRSTWQSKCSNTFKLQALSCQCWLGKKKKKTTVDIKIKTTMRYHLTPGRMAIIQKSVTSAAAQLLQSCQTLCHPRTEAFQAPLSIGFSRQEYWSELSCPPSRLRDQTQVSHWKQILYRSATILYHLTPVRMAIIKKSTNNECRRGCGGKGNPLVLVVAR